MRLTERSSFYKAVSLFLFILSLSFGLTHCSGTKTSDPVIPNLTHTVGGTVSGLTGSGLVLQNSGGDDLAISADGPFTFPTPTTIGSAYTVNVKTQPSNPDQGCSVTNASGVIAGADVTNVAVSCVGVLAACTSGSIQYNHNTSADVSGFTQQIVVTGSVPFTCDAANNITGSGTVNIAITGGTVATCTDCSWTSAATMNVTLSGGFSGTGGIDFAETWYVGSPAANGTCTDTCNGGSTPIQWPYPEVANQHTIDFPMIDGYTHVGPASGPGTSGTYEFTLFIQ